MITLVPLRPLPEAMPRAPRTAPDPTAGAVALTVRASPPRPFGQRPHAPRRRRWPSRGIPLSPFGLRLRALSVPHQHLQFHNKSYASKKLDTARASDWIWADLLCEVGFVAPCCNRTYLDCMVLEIFGEVCSAFISWEARFPSACQLVAH